tara:strand:+ start:3542 stop:3808 length:267 start_codon:yes stop_codon:yes gene_type:complete
MKLIPKQNLIIAIVSIMFLAIGINKYEFFNPGINLSILIGLLGIDFILLYLLVKNNYISKIKFYSSLKAGVFGVSLLLLFVLFSFLYN